MLDSNSNNLNQMITIIVAACKRIWYSKKQYWFDIMYFHNLIGNFEAI
ncbi:MAG: hypothetical protein ACJ0O9_00435 [Flavobacteriaceae bacterium]